jgi:hypothetical protein
MYLSTIHGTSPHNLRNYGIVNQAIQHITISVTYSPKRLAHHNVCFNQISGEDGCPVAPHDVVLILYIFVTSLGKEKNGNSLMMTAYL